MGFFSGLDKGYKEFIRQFEAASEVTGGCLGWLLPWSAVVSVIVVLIFLVQSQCNGSSRRLGGGTYEAEEEPLSDAAGNTEDLTASALETPSAALSRWLGRWEGEGRQFTPRQQWRIQMELALVGPVAGTIRYPTLDCGGDLVLIEANESTWKLRENITYGRNCITGGTITMVSLSASRAQWLWYSPQGELGAQGEVKKQDE